MLANGLLNEISYIWTKFEWIASVLFPLSSHLLWLFLKFYYNNRRLLFEIESSRCDFEASWTLANSNRSRRVVHLVTRPNGNFAGRTAHQSVHNSHLECCIGRLILHHPVRITNSSGRGRKKNIHSLTNLRLIMKRNSEHNLTDIKMRYWKEMSHTRHNGLGEPRTPTQPCESCNGTVQPSFAIIGKSSFLGWHVDVEWLSAVSPSSQAAIVATLCS